MGIMLSYKLINQMNATVYIAARTSQLHTPSQTKLNELVHLLLALTFSLLADTSSILLIHY